MRPVAHCAFRGRRRTAELTVTTRLWLLSVFDDKVICVPLHDPYWNAYETLEDLPLPLRQEIEQFFSIYKDLEEGKTVGIEGWCSVEEAAREITAARERARSQA